jgi:hypothetical protein
MRPAMRNKYSASIKSAFYTTVEFRWLLLPVVNPEILTRSFPGKEYRLRRGFCWKNQRFFLKKKRSLLAENGYNYK